MEYKTWRFVEQLHSFFPRLHGLGSSGFTKAAREEQGKNATVPLYVNRLKNSLIKCESKAEKDAYTKDTKMYSKNCENFDDLAKLVNLIDSTYSGKKEFCTVRKML